jgi:hypothetical protein
VWQRRRYRDVYGWDLFDKYNAIAAPRFEKELGALILRADKITYRRPDGHYLGDKEDCYHYHLPGVPDWWTKVLFNVWGARFGLH